MVSPVSRNPKAKKMNTVVEGAIRPSSVVEETAVADEKLERSDYYEVAGEMIDHCIRCIICLLSGSSCTIGSETR